MTDKETEYKWQIASQTDFEGIKEALASFDYSCALSAPNLLDTYFDTPDSALSAEKSALRLRRIKLAGQTRYELTFKSASSIVDGLAQRREITMPLNCANRKEALKKFRAEASALNPKAVNLKPIFSIENKRRVWYIRAKDFEAELSFDDCLIKARRCQRMLEAEFEFKNGKMSSFKAFAARLAERAGLKAAVKSKVATARGLLAEDKINV